MTAFPRASEFEKMREALTTLGLPFEIIDPSPGYSRVGCPAIAMEPETRAALASAHAEKCITAGWVEYRLSSIRIPTSPPPSFAEDIFGTASIMVIAPCIADEKKIRLVAHLSGDVGAAMPYLNTEMREGCYNADGETFTFMDGYRMITVYPRRISIAKADDIIDAWRTLEKIRCRINDTYSQRSSIEPTYEMRKKPPALEIYKRLPGTNCGICGQKTCMAFALSLWSGNAKPSQCTPIFEGDFLRLKAAFLEICSGLGVANTEMLFEEA